MTWFNYRFFMLLTCLSKWEIRPDQEFGFLNDQMTTARLTCLGSTLLTQSGIHNPIYTQVVN